MAGERGTRRPPRPASAPCLDCQAMLRDVRGRPNDSLLL